MCTKDDFQSQKSVVSFSSTKQTAGVDNSLSFSIIPLKWHFDRTRSPLSYSRLRVENILYNWSLSKSKWSLCSIPNERQFSKVSHFTPPHLLSHCGFLFLVFPLSSLVGAGELTEFEIVISGKIMGNPWESCWSRETMESAPHKSTFSGNAHVLFSFISSAEFQGRQKRWNGSETPVQQSTIYPAINSQGQLCRKHLCFLSYEAWKTTHIVFHWILEY